MAFVNGRHIESYIQGRVQPIGAGYAQEAGAPVFACEANGVRLIRGMAVDTRIVPFVCNLAVTGQHLGLCLPRGLASRDSHSGNSQRDGQYSPHNNSV